MDEQTKKSIITKEIMIRYGIHALVTLIIAVGIVWFSNNIILENTGDATYFLFTGILFGIILLFYYLERNVIYNSLKNMAILSLCFLISGLLLLLSDYYINLPLWLIGGLVAVALVNRNIGMLYLYFLVFQAIYLQGNMINGLVFHFVVSTLICIFIPKMKSFSSMLYMMAFAGCIIVTGSFINNRFDINGSMLLNTFYILCTYLGCILVTMLLVKWNNEQSVSEEEDSEIPNDYKYLELLAQDTAERDTAAALEAEKNFIEIEHIEVEHTDLAVEEIVVEEIDEAVVEEITEKPIDEFVEENIDESVEELAPDYTLFCNEKSELLLELRDKNRALYAQSVLLGKLAAEMAMAIGLNAELTKAAGLYKRIGKILDDGTEETAAEIAATYEFPVPLVQLLDELNHDIIAQKEAAVILLTDAIISYYSVVRHGQKSNLAVEKIVDMVVIRKMFQGDFNESGLSVQECVILREKMIELLNEQNRKHAERMKQ